MHIQSLESSVHVRISPDNQDRCSQKLKECVSIRSQWRKASFLRFGKKKEKKIEIYGLFPTLAEKKRVIQVFLLSGLISVGKQTNKRTTKKGGDLKNGRK